MTLMWKEISEEPKVMENCLNKNSDLITEIVKELKGSGINHVMIAARGTSDHAAIYAKYMMGILVGIPVTLAAPSIYTVYNKNLKLDKALVIGISQSGKAADVLEVIKAANSAGALTVSITNFPDSPLAEEAKYHLDLSAGLEKSVAATKTFVAQLTILAALTACWADDKALMDELRKIPQGVDQVLKSSGYIAEKAQRYRYMEDCFVLARGVNYSLAMECALKIQETCYVKAKAYATSDFYHGPYAMIERDTPVFIFAPSGLTQNDTKDMIIRLKGSGAEVVVISDDKEMLDMGTTAFEIPKASNPLYNDAVSPFFNAVIAQVFACNLSLAKGLNPDNPRELKKVTITK